MKSFTMVPKVLYDHVILFFYSPAHWALATPTYFLSLECIMLLLPQGLHTYSSSPSKCLLDFSMKTFRRPGTYKLYPL